MQATYSLAHTEQVFIDAVVLVLGNRVSRDRITSQTRLIEDLAMSSIELLNLMLVCERDLGVSPTDDDDLVETLSTVGRAAKALYDLRVSKTDVVATNA